MARTAARVAFAFLIVVATSFFAPAPADACSCVGGIPLCETFWKTSAVFVGEVASITPTAPADPTQPSGLFARRRVRFTVEKTYRGDVGREVEVFTGMGGGDCGFNFIRGRKYLVFAHAFEGRMTTGICSPTRLLADADEALAYLNQASSSSQGGRIFGAAVFRRRDGQEPAAEHKVVLRGPAREWTATTDKAGKFEFTGVPAGQYQIELQGTEGWWGGQARQVELVDPRACVGADFYLVPNGRVHLKIANTTVDPIKPLALALIDVDALDESPVRNYHTALAVATGDVTWEQVPPGRYVIGLNVAYEPNPERPYLPTFYPGTSDAKSAKVIDIALGQRVEVPAFSIPPPRSLLTVRGTVVRTDSRVVAGASVMLVSAEPHSKGRVAASARSANDGRFALSAVEGVRYRVRVFANGIRVESDPFEVTAATAPILMVLRGGK